MVKVNYAQQSVASNRFFQSSWMGAFTRKLVGPGDVQQPTRNARGRVPFKIDEAYIAQWMQERYDLWKTSSAQYAQTDSDYWSRQLNAELPLRLKALRILARYVDDPAKVSVLDVGIGEGMFPWLLKNLGLNVIGLGWGGETSQGELERANPGVRALSVRSIPSPGRSEQRASIS